MAHCIMVATDLHEASLMNLVAADREAAVKLPVANTPAGRGRLWREAKRQARRLGGARVVVAYEASSLGFGFYDEAVAQGFDCYVLAPTKIARSASHRRRKTDERDAERLLELLRGHVLAGNPLPAVWVPDAATRADREVVRARLDVAAKRTALKAQVQSLLKRQSERRPAATGKGWTGTFLAWLRGLSGAPSPLPPGARVALATLLRQLAALDAELELLDRAVAALSAQPRYAGPVPELAAVQGVGLLTAMVFLTEIGDLGRFANRKELGAYLGLAPSSDESGERGERKGHITHQGPWRVRRVLCQCTWSRMRTDAAEQAAYARIAAKNPRHKKIAVVALMRRLAVVLWHRGREAQQRHGCFAHAA